MKILVLNQIWFAEEWRAAGHEVITVGHRPQFDVILPEYFLTVQTILEKLPGLFEPDVIVYYDDSMPIHIIGLEYSEVPILFYSVDQHHHINFHKYMAAMFDYTLVAHKDYVAAFIHAGACAEWMPLWASRYFEPSDEKRYEAVFVGTLNRTLNPERVKFFKKLSKRVPIHVTTGQFWEIYPQSEVVVNQSVLGDLNFRVFESMMSGAALLTENTSNGLRDLFKVGVHLEVYQRGNVKDAALKIKALLKDRNKCREIGAAGREEILRKHTTSVRGEQILQRLMTIEKMYCGYRNFAAVAAYSHALLQVEKFDRYLASKLAVESVHRIGQALLAREPLPAGIENSLAIVCTQHDLYTRDQKGQETLYALLETFPTAKVVILALIRLLLNKGASAEARRIAKSYLAEDVAKVFSVSEDVMQELLRPAYEDRMLGMKIQRP